MFYFTKEMVPDLERYLSLYYHKILHIDLADDTFQVVLMQDGEEAPPNENIRDWMADFVKKNVHPDDAALFTDNTLRKKFFNALDGEAIEFEYRRRVGRGDEYSLMKFIFIPDGNSDTTGYVFIKYAE